MKESFRRDLLLHAQKYATRHEMEDVLMQTWDDLFDYEQALVLDWVQERLFKVDDGRRFAYTLAEVFLAETGISLTPGQMSAALLKLGYKHSFTRGKAYLSFYCRFKKERNCGAA